MWDLEHPTQNVHEDTHAALGGFHHSERITAQHGSPLFRSFLREQILQCLDGRDTELLKVAANHRVVQHLLRAVREDFAHVPEGDARVTIRQQADHALWNFTGFLDLLQRFGHSDLPFLHGLEVILLRFLQQLRFNRFL